MDNLKKKKLDGKRISKQKWEIAYLRAIAKEQLTLLERSKNKLIFEMSPKKMIRICKALLKFTK